MTLALVAFFYCLFGASGYSRVFADADAGWHIRTGERILDSRSLPVTDPWSFSKAGQTWYAWEWGADVGLAALHRAAGLKAVALGTCAVFAVCVWLWVRLHWLVGGELAGFIVLSPLALPSTLPHVFARPHVASWVFLLATLLVVERAPAHLRFWHGPAAFAFVAIWANVHPSFFVAFAMAGVYAMGYWVTGDRTQRRRAYWIAAMGATAFLGSLANPRGWNLHDHMYRFLTDWRLLSRIQEYQSPDFHEPGSLLVMATLLVAMGSVAFLVQRRSWSRALLVLFLVVGSLRSVRMIPFLALLGLPLVNPVLSDGLRSGRRFARWLDDLSAFRTLDRSVRGYLLAPLALAVAWLALGRADIARQTGFPADRFPVHATEALAVEGVPARVFTVDQHGGYLIYKFNGRLKVFIDGRVDFYGASFVEEYVTMLSAKPGWRTLFERHLFTHALLPGDVALLDALRREGWREIASDPTAVLLRAPASGTVMAGPVPDSYNP